MDTNYTNLRNSSTDKINKLIFPELSYSIVSLCFDIHNELGRFAREKQYGDALEKALRKQKISYRREFRAENTGNILDFIIENKLILELKAKRFILKEDYYQVQRYLQTTSIKLGLLINFRNRFLKPIRVIRLDTDARRKFV